MIALPNFKLGVIGQGFVGSSVSKAFRKNCGLDVMTYDKYFDERSNASLKEIALKCQIIFVCVPTPMTDDGDCDITIVGDVCEELNMHAPARRDTFKPILVIKSTIIPGTTELIQGRLPHVDILFNPEFLNARSAYEDFITQDHVVLGGSKRACDYVAELFKMLVPDAKMVKCSSRTAEMVKYVKNSFFATKVSFANEVYQVCKNFDVEYDDMIEIAQLDNRMGREHWKVPGPSPSPTGELLMGFGGMCLPKDLQAFFRFTARQGVSPKVMRAAWDKNLEVRPGRDWEQVSGVKRKKE